MLTAERARALFDYDPATGALTWKANHPDGKSAMINKRFRGKEAGSVDKGLGYRKIGIDGRKYLVHRVIWLIVHGEWPAHDIDHEDGKRSDNRLAKMREATRGQNLKNAQRRKDNTSGVTGVSRRGKKWVASICSEGVRQRLGLFASFDEAVMVRRTAQARLGFHPNHGREAVA
jgi:hypothetical protein